MKKYGMVKLMALLTAVALTLLILPTYIVSAEENIANNNKFAKPIDRLTEVPEGYIGIYTAEDLEDVRNNLDGRYILMSDIDVSILPGGTMEPIGSAEYLRKTEDATINEDAVPFTGIFDGNGYVIKNMTYLSVPESEVVRFGLFAMTDGAEIRNLGMESDENLQVPSGDTNSAGCFTGTAANHTSFGGIVGGYRNVKVDNCYFFQCVNFSSEHADMRKEREDVVINGIVGSADTFAENECFAEVTNCINYGNLVAYISYPEGPVPCNYSLSGIGGTDVKGCTNYGDVTVSNGYSLFKDKAYSYVSGIANNANVSDCTNCGNLDIAHYGIKPEEEFTGYVNDYIGGISAYSEKSIQCCINNGGISDSFTDCTSRFFNIYDGGIAGYMYGESKDVKNVGDVKVTLCSIRTEAPTKEGHSEPLVRACMIYAGGAFGELNSKAPLYRTANNGNVSVTTDGCGDVRETYIGGLCGHIHSLHEDEQEMVQINKVGLICDSYSLGNVCYTSANNEIHEDGALWYSTFAGGLCGGVGIGFNKEKDFFLFKNVYTYGDVKALTAEDTRVVCGKTVGAEGHGTFGDDGIPPVMQNVYTDESELPLIGCKYYEVTSETDVKLENVLTVSAEDMQKQESYAGFDFENVWDINTDENCGYPFLRSVAYEGKSGILGDCNNDGKVNTADAVYILRVASGIKALDSNSYADMDENGMVNTYDAVVILKICSGM